MAANDPSLAGLNILVTRPAHQAGPLAEMIRGLGGKPLLFPVLEIFDTEHPEPLRHIIERLEEFDLAIFISPNAVDKAMNLIGAWRKEGIKLPAGLKVASVGKGGLTELRRAPERTCSESPMPVWRGHGLGRGPDRRNN